MTMNEQAMAQLREYCARHQLQALLLASPATLTWLTGYAPPIQTGPSPFEGGPALAWWQDGQLSLVLSDAEAAAAAESGAAVHDYLSYSIDEPMQGMRRQVDALRGLIQPAAGLKGR